MKKFMKKIITVLLAMAMLMSSLPLGVIATANDDVVKKADGTEAVEKYNYYAADEYIEINDGYLRVRVSTSNGGFSVTTVEGDALSKSDNNKDLIYSDDYFDTSFTSFRVIRNGDSTDYIFGRDYSNAGVQCSAVNVYKSADNAITAEWSVDGLYFKQIIALMGADTYQHGMAYISYSVANMANTQLDKVEARVMMDTALGTKDFGYYMLAQSNGSYVEVNKEKTILGSDYHNYFFAYDDKGAPAVTSYTLNASVAGESIVPSKVTFAHWSNLASTVYDYTPSTNAPLDFTDTYGSIEYLTADSAVALYYDMYGNSNSVSNGNIGLYYGVYSNYKAQNADVALNLISTGTMFFNDAKTAYKDINGDLAGNFSSTMKVQNVMDKEISKLAVAVYPEEQILPYNDNNIVTDISAIKPYYKTISGLKAGEIVDVRFDFMVEPTIATGYRRIKIAIHDISEVSGLTDDNLILEDEIFILCPGASGEGLGFTGMTPEQVFVKGKRFAYITGTNFGLIRDKTQYRIILRPNNGGEDVVLDQDKVVVNTELNTVTLVLDMELDPTTYKVIIDWNDTKLEDVENEALRLIVTDVPTKGDPGYVSSGVYGIVTVERNGTHYDIVNYSTEEDFNKTQTKPNDIMVVLRGDFNVLSSDEKGNYQAEGLTLMDGDIININEALDVKNGRVTVTKNFDENGKQTEITVDIDGKVYTTKENTKVWDGVLAITSFIEGTLYTLPIYSEQGVLSYAEGEEDGERITLLWPGAAGGMQTLVGLLLNFRYGEFALMKQGDDLARVVAFGASLDPSILVPNGTVGTEVHYSNLEKAHQKMGVSNYSAEQLRATDFQLRKDQMAWRDKQAGTLNLYMDDILFGAGGFIGFNTEINVGIPSYAEGMPYVNGTLALKIINDYWEFGVDGEADMLVFEMEATLKLKSYNGIPVPDEIYFFIGGTNPGIPVDPFGVFWVRGAGAGISNMYETFFGRQLIPPITLLISGEFAIFSVLSARANVSLSPQGIGADLQNVGVAGITLIDYIGGSVYWYPNFSLSFGIRVDILDAIIGEGSVIVEERSNGVYFCGYAKATLKIPDKIWIIGGLKVGSAAIGIDSDKVWGSAEIIGIGFGVKYYWGGSVDVSIGKEYDVPTPRNFAQLKAIPLYSDAATGQTLYMDITNVSENIGLDKTEIQSSADGLLHSFILDSDAQEDGMLVINYSADNLLMAQDHKNNISIEISGEEYKLEWYDSAYDADHIANLGTNAIFNYDANSKNATVAISFVDGSCFDREITVKAVTASELSILGIARTTTLSEIAMSEDLKTVTVLGKGLQLLSELGIYAEDANGALYMLSTVEGKDLDDVEAVINIEIPQNLPTGEYTLKAIGKVQDEAGNDIASPITESSFEYVNPNQPKAINGAEIKLNGNYTILAKLDCDELTDGFAVTVYEKTADGHTATIYKDLEFSADSFEDAENLSMVLGGRYSNTDENGVTTYYGLEAGKKYVISVQSYVITENGSKLLSEPILSNELVMVMPTETKPTFSIDGAASVEVGESGIKVDTVNKSSVTVNIDGAENIVSGSYILGKGEKVEWNGSDIKFDELPDGVYTLRVEGINATMDSFSAVYQFSIDTNAPGLFISSHQGGGLFSGTSVTVSGSTEAYSKVEISIVDGSTSVVYADENGNFTGTVAVDESLAYQHLRIKATDGAGNESMPFGCTLTNEILGSEGIEAVILYQGREIDAIDSDADAKQLTFAFKLGNKYVTLNKNSSAYSRVKWSVDTTVKNAVITDDGVLTGDRGANGIVVVTLDNMNAYVPLISLDLASADIKVDASENELVYDGQEKKPAISVNGKIAVEEGTDYTVSYLNNIDAGVASAVVVATENGKCIGTNIVNFTIQKCKLSVLSFELIEDGSEEPQFTLTHNGKELVMDRDYTVSYKLSNDGSRGVITVEGKGNYEGMLTQEYEIDNFDHLVWIIPVAFVSILGIGVLVIFLIRRKRKKSKVTENAE